MATKKPKLKDRPHRPTSTGGENVAGKIKGITITLGADVQPLNKALADVNKKSKDLQSELRQVETSKIKSKDTNVGPETKLLAEAVANSKEKLTGSRLPSSRSMSSLPRAK